MKEVLLSLMAGLLVGIIFKLIKLPIPAPPVLSGVVGIVGVYLGAVFVDWVSKIMSH
jgi:XapX domain-containing protein